MVNVPGAPHIAHGEKFKRYIPLAGAAKIKTPGACGAPKKNPPGPSTLGSRGCDTQGDAPAARIVVSR
jgi:hypothetical protein